MSQDRDSGPGDATRASREDAVIGMVVMGVAAVIVFGAFQVPGSSYSNAVLAPRDFPLLVGILMAVAGAVLLLRNVGALRRVDAGALVSGESARPAPVEQPDEDEPETIEIPQSAKKLAMLLLLLLGYIRLFIPLGYNISTFLFLAIGSMLLAPRNAVRNLVFAAVLTVLVYLLFTHALNVELPPGPLGGAL